jgi:hypothetical protein
MNEFRAGEKAIIHSIVGHYAYLNGTECTIVEPAADRLTVDRAGVKKRQIACKIRLSDGDEFAVMTHRLRKWYEAPAADQSERNSVVSWGDCHWRPTA